MALANTILLSECEGNSSEALAGASGIYPGMLVMPTSAVPDTAVVHATAGGDTETLIVVEDGLVGGTVDTVYASGGLMKLYSGEPGDVVQMRLTYGVSYARGDVLISAGDGSLKKTTGSPAKVFGRIEEAIDYTSESTLNKLGKVRLA